MIHCPWPCARSQFGESESVAGWSDGTSRARPRGPSRLARHRSIIRILRVTPLSHPPSSVSACVRRARRGVSCGSCETRARAPGVTAGATPGESSCRTHQHGPMSDSW
eukprot:3348170-Prymnesium_polylepis.1